MFFNHYQHLVICAIHCDNLIIFLEVWITQKTTCCIIISLVYCNFPQIFVFSFHTFYQLIKEVPENISFVISANNSQCGYLHFDAFSKAFQKVHCLLASLDQSNNQIVRCLHSFFFRYFFILLFSSFLFSRILF